MNQTYMKRANKFTQTVLALRVPGGFSSDLGGDPLDQPQVYGRAFLMQIICIRDIYPSKPMEDSRSRKFTPSKHSV